MQLTLQTRMQLEEVQRRLRLTDMPITQPANRPPQQSKTDNAATEVSSFENPSRHAKLGALLGCIMQEHGIGDHAYALPRNAPLPQEAGSDIEIEDHDDRCVVADGIILSNKYGALPSEGEEASQDEGLSPPMDYMEMQNSRKRPPTDDPAVSKRGRIHVNFNDDAHTFVPPKVSPPATVDDEAQVAK